MGDSYDPDGFLRKLLETVPKLSSIDTQMVMSDLYKLEFGITNRVKLSSPLGTVAMHQAEDMNTGHILRDALRSYIDNDIQQCFGLTVLEFLDLPVDVVETMLMVSAEKKAKKNEHMSEVERILNGGQPK